MAPQLGYYVGGFVILYLVSALVLLDFRDKKYTYQAVTIAAAIALAIGTYLAAYGMSTGSGLDFGAAFGSYLPPAIAVLIVNLIRVNRKQAKAEKE